MTDPSLDGSLDESLVALGWDQDWANQYRAATDGLPGPLRAARVVRVAGISAHLTWGGPTEPARLESPAPFAPLAETPATGDWVVFHTDHDDDGVRSVVAILPRRTRISRRDPAELDAEQVLAANVDLVLVFHALDRPFSERRLERLLVLAFDSGAQPMVLLTKADLAPHSGPVVERVEAVARDVPVAVISSTTGEGLDEVRRRLGTGRTAVLVGESGAGKSTFVNALAGTDVQSTGAVRNTDGAGRHTTTTRDLILLPGGGLILDTPGLRALGLWDAASGMSQAFPEIGALAGLCRFRDCRHGQEPACAVREALESGELEQRRYESWLDLRAELEDLDARLTERHRRQGEGRRPKRRRSGR